MRDGALWGIVSGAVFAGGGWGGGALSGTFCWNVSECHSHLMSSGMRTHRRERFRCKYIYIYIHTHIYIYI